MKTLCFNPLLALALGQLLGPVAHAATFYWVGALDGDWNVAGNWIPGAPPNDGTADLIFMGGANPSSMLTSAWRVRTITFGASPGTNPFMIAGNQALTIGTGGITNNDNDTQTFNIPLNIAQGTYPWINGSAGPIIFKKPVTLPSGRHFITGDVAFQEPLVSASAGSSPELFMPSGSLSFFEDLILAEAGNQNFSDSQFKVNGVFLDLGFLSIGDNTRGAELSSGIRLATLGTTTLDPMTTLVINGGQLSTGTLINNNGTLDFLSGTLAITGSNGLKIGVDGPLGSFFAVSTGRSLVVTHTASVLNGAMLEITGGTFTAGTLDNTGTTELSIGSLQVGNLINHPGGGIFVSKTLTTTGTAVENQAGGSITLRDGTGRLSGTAALANFGLLTGDGRIDLPVTNQATGELRADGGQILKLAAPNGTNAGRINLLGGGMEFQQALTNSATGRIQGSGYAFFDGGLVNQGAMSFSGGDTDLFGRISLTGGPSGNARLISSGGGTVTLYDDFVHNGVAVGASGGSALVFFGNVTGSGPFTGTGDIYFESGFTPGNSPAMVTFQGSFIGGGGLVTRMEIGGLARGSQYDSVQVGGNLSLDGTLSLALINGFQPGVGDRFDLFDWNTLTGTFDTLELPALAGGLQWDTSNLYTTGTLAVRDLNRLEDWRWVHFGNPATVGIGSDLNDPDHDGVANLVEYACNLNPQAPDAYSLTQDGSSGLPAVSTAPGGHLRITFLRRTAASVPAILHEVLFSDGLGDWKLEPGAETRIEPIDALWERVTVTDPVPPAASRFARIRVTSQ